MLQQIKKQIDRIRAKGAIYVDTRWYPYEEKEYLMMWNGNLKSTAASTESGLGIRVLHNGAWGFSASSDLSNIEAIYEKAFDNARVAAERVDIPIRLAEKDIIQAQFDSPNTINPFEVALGEKVSFLKEMDELLNKEGVAQRIADMEFTQKKIMFLDSEGSEIEKNIIEVFANLQVMGVDNTGNTQTRSFRLSRNGTLSRGWESMNKEYFRENAERVVKELNLILNADDCPKDDRSVIILPDMMFLQTHETIGHALELDRILGYELAFAGGSFVTLDDFGKLQYGSEKLTVRANATLPNSPGSFGYDDDGVQAQDYLLIDKGVLVNAITGRQMVEEANRKAKRQIFNGSGGTNRATSFYRPPIERMTNINIDAGNDGTLEDIVADTENGLIVDKEKSWSIGSNREQFHFGAEIGWIVKDGEVKDVVKNPTYKDDTVKFWNSLSAVGDKSTWKTIYVDNCGKGQPNQIMQLAHGIPVCRFENVRIGE